jgi:7,8-dihydroneopterin aldolase/epimerase/oxygenase
MTQHINVEGIRLYGYHGCLEEEGKIGQEYRIDVFIETDFSSAAETDDLLLTIDYCTVYEIVKAEMGIRSKLIEQVAWRIKKRLESTFKTIHQVRVKVTKFNPPMNGNVQQVSVET